jgi:EAL domain-containing protein (putative c-di-GMP-specific phosphodiesterase class I)
VVVASDLDELGEVGAVADQLSDLRSAGVRVGIDLDAGNVSLDALRKLPADLVVLGAPLIGDLAADGTRAVVGAVLGVAEVLGSVVVAGGIDDGALLGAARAVGVDLVHGERIGPAAEADELAPWFSALTAPG